MTAAPDPDPTAPPRWSRGRVAVLLAALLAFYAFPLGFWPDLPGANETAHMYLAMALYDRGEPFVDTEVRDYFFSHDCTFDGEHYRSNKQPGLGIWLVPGVAIVDWLVPGPPEMVHVHYGARVLMIAIPFVLFLLLLGRTLEGLVRPSVAWAIVIAYALGSNAAVYATRLFSHDVTALLLGSAFILLWRGTRLRWLAGAACGWAVLCETQTLGVALVLTVLAAFDRERRFRPMALVSFGLGAVAVAAILFGYNAAAHGGAATTGYAKEFDKFAVDGSFYGFEFPELHKPAKLLFSPMIGLFFHAPWLLLAIPATWWCVRRSRGDRFFLIGAAVAVLVQLALVASHQYWLGGATVGPRYITPVVPLLLIVLAAGFGARRLPNPTPWIAGAAALVVAGIAWHVVLILTTTDINTWGDQWALNPISAFAFPLLGKGITTLTTGRVVFGMGPGSSGVLLVVLALVPIAALAWWTLKDGAPRAALLGGAGAGLLLFVVLGRIGADTSWLTETHHPRLFGFMSEKHLRRDGEIAFKWRPSAGPPRTVAYARTQHDDRFATLHDPAAPLEEIVRDLNYATRAVGLADGSVLVAELMKNVVYRIPASGVLEVWRENAGCAHRSIADIRFPGVNDIVRHPTTGDLLMTEGGRRRIVAVSAQGDESVVVERYGDKRLNMPNSMAARRDGWIYFTDPTAAMPPLRNGAPIPGFERELPFAGIFRTRGESVTLLESRVPAPLDLAFAPDESTLYVVDLAQREFILAFPVLADGTLGAPREFGRVTGKPHRQDQSVAVDEQGNVWIAGTDGVRVLDRVGARLGTIRGPRPFLGITFGGADGKTLYLTDGRSVYRMTVGVAGAEPR